MFSVTAFGRQSMNRIMRFMMLISLVNSQETYRVMKGMNERGNKEMPVMITAKERVITEILESRK